PAAQVEVVCVQVLRRLGGERLLLRGRQLDAQRLGDPARDLVLHREDGGPLAGVAVGPHRPRAPRGPPRAAAGTRTRLPPRLMLPVRTEVAFSCWPTWAVATGLSRKGST